MEIPNQLRDSWAVIQREIERLRQRVAELEKENESLKEETACAWESANRYSKSLRQAINPEPYKRPGYWKVWGMARQFELNLEKIREGKFKGRYLLNWGAHYRVFGKLKEVWDLVSEETFTHSSVFPTHPAYQHQPEPEPQSNNDVTQELLDAYHPPRLPKRHPSIAPKSFSVPKSLWWWEGQTWMKYQADLDQQRRESELREKEDRWREWRLKYGRREHELIQSTN